MGGTNEGGTGGSYSLDNGMTWTAFASKPANTRGDGTIAISADGTAFVWTPERGAAHVSSDRGKTWMPCEKLPPRLRVVADRADPAAFYAFDKATGTLHASADGGRTFAAARHRPAARRRIRPRRTRPRRPRLARHRRGRTDLRRRRQVVPPRSRP